MDEVLALRVFKSFVGIAGILGNSLVCMVIIRVSSLQTRTNAFIFHQAVVDFLGSSTILLLDEIPVPHPLPDNALGWFICHAWSSSLILLYILNTSNLSLLAVTLERYFAIVHPFKYQRFFSHQSWMKVGLAFALCWIISGCFAATGICLLEREDSVCFVRWRPTTVTFSVVYTVTMFVVPVAVMLFAYIRTSAELKRGAIRASLGSGQPEGMAQSLLRARRNTFKTLLVVFVSYMVCWTPLQVMILLNIFGVLIYSPFIVAVAATNCCVNPAIYAFKYRQFRQGLRAVFCLRHNRTAVSTIA